MLACSQVRTTVWGGLGGQKHHDIAPAGARVTEEDDMGGRCAICRASDRGGCCQPAGHFLLPLTTVYLALTEECQQEMHTSTEPSSCLAPLDTCGYTLFSFRHARPPGPFLRPHLLQGFLTGLVECQVVYPGGSIVLFIKFVMSLGYWRDIVV